MRHGQRGEYAVRCVEDAFHDRELEALLGQRRALIVVSPTVERILGSRIHDAFGSGTGRVLCIRSSSGETGKTFSAVETICRGALALRLDRRGVIVAIGGGVCCDLVTVAASLYRRGVLHARIPTTLVGQIDAGLGAKGAVNFAGRKNALGCYHPPKLVLLDRALLRSLPLEEIRCGIAEIIKMALASDPELFEAVETHLGVLLASRFQAPDGAAQQVTEVAARRMLEALQGNLFEDRSLRRTVDAGHTFSPALEAASGFALRHGEAVAIDLALCAVISKRLGLLASGECERVLRLIDSAGLPIYSGDFTEDLARTALQEAIAHRGGRLHLPLFQEIGRVSFLESVAAVDHEIASALEELSNWHTSAVAVS
jgi:3-dehydroquinate synthase